MITLSTQLMKEINAHVLKEYPREACGVIANGEYIPCLNRSTSPTTHFEIAVEDYAHLLVEKRLQAVVHSHCSTQYQRLDPRTPSYEDQASWMAMRDVPWLIFHCNGKEVSAPLVLDDSTPAPLLERDYIYGIQDCYSIIRDYYRMNLGIQLPNVPRAPEFWKTGNAYFEKYFEEFGFYEVPVDQAGVNDLVFMKVATSTVINHAGVITGPNEFLHQLHGKYSTHDSLARWSKQIVKTVRYKGKESC